MLTPEKIKALEGRAWLTTEEQVEVIDTLLFYLSINERQAQLLTQAIDNVVALRQRMDFYRKATIKLV